MQHFTADAGRSRRRITETILNNRVSRAIVANRAVEAIRVAASGVFPPSTTDPRILMSDVSFNQGSINIGKYLAYGPPKFRGTVIRTGQGRLASYDDTQFVPNVQKCEGNKHPWMVYHVLVPDQNTDQQVDRLLHILDSHPPPRYIWWDVQLKRGQTKRHISNATIHAVTRTKRETGIGAGVYSAKWFTDGYMETQDWFQDIDWWLAQWLSAQAEHPGPNALPATVTIDQVMIHQTTSKGDGLLVGMQSKQLDLDRWMWGVARFAEIMGPIDTDPDPTEGLTAGLAKIMADADSVKREAEQLQNIVNQL